MHRECVFGVELAPWLANPARMRWLPYGPDALLIYFADGIGEEAFRRGRALAAALEKNPPRHLREYVPSFTSVLLEFEPGLPLDGNAIVKRLSNLMEAPAPEPVTREIPVRYDGPDLALVAEHAGLSQAEVVAAHAAPLYKVYILGFSPGFPYLGDLDPRLHTPRQPNPRLRVPAGSVAIGGEHTGIYPVAGPGGWNLIGRTDFTLFDPAAARGDNFRLLPGEQVRFVPVS